MNILEGLSKIVAEYLKAQGVHLSICKYAATFDELKIEAVLPPDLTARLTLDSQTVYMLNRPETREHAKMLLDRELYDLTLTLFTEVVEHIKAHGGEDILKRAVGFYEAVHNAREDGMRMNRFPYPETK
jgi:hypothetical protein